MSGTLSPERWAQIKRLLDESEALSKDELPAWLDRICGDDQDLRRELDSLLGFEEEIGLLEATAHDPERWIDAAVDPHLGQKIGPYRLQAVLGEGGMGTVYLAEREEEFEQRAALKLMRSKLTSREYIERFHRERRILARLEHPGIARLLDGGTTDDGSPWFAMELIDGSPIDRYCAQAELTPDAVVALFLQVCAALQYAHRNLIVHRDLKPGNVLISSDGQVKLLDFGIAKFLDGHTETSAITEQMAPLTVRYASPEQLKNEPISTASDVYSAAVVLYKMLTGHLPCKLEELGDLQAITAIGTRAPQPPSALRPGLHRDLDAILLRALEKKAEDRYGSIDLLADDLQRHLDGTPVRAHPATLWYRADKFIRRHRWGLSVTALGIVFVILFVLAIDRERRRAEALSDFLIDLGRMTWSGRALSEESDQELQQALATWRELDPRDSPEIARLLNDFGAFSSKNGALGRAKLLFRQSIAMRERLGLDEETIKPRNNLASILLIEGKLEEAEKLYRRGLKQRRELFGPRHRNVATSLNALAVVHLLQEDWSAAKDFYLEAQDIYLSHMDRRTPLVAGTLAGLARIAYELDQTQEAEQLYAEALEVFRETLPPDSLFDARVEKDYALLLIDHGRIREAEPLITHALDELCTAAGKDWTCADARSIYGAFLAASGRLAEAADSLQAGAEALAEIRGAENFYTRRAQDRREELLQETTTKGVDSNP